MSYFQDHYFIIYAFCKLHSVKFKYFSILFMAKNVKKTQVQNVNLDQSFGNKKLESNVYNYIHGNILI